jgi:PAS domain S-box-containing protein
LDYQFGPIIKKNIISVSDNREPYELVWIYRILYVDDEPDLLDLGKLFLEKDGQFSVDICSSALEALDLLGTNTYEAIISDYMMPEMNGIEFLKTVRTSGKTIPFILFTGRGREVVVIQALNEGANFYLQKGGNFDAQFAELAHKTRISIEHHRSAEKLQALNRLYSVLSAVNKAVVRLRTKEEFFSEIFRILVQTGGFRMVWIGIADPQHKVIRPVASDGHVSGYLDSVNISTEDVPRGRGPTGTAYREERYYLCNDIASDPRMEPWRDDALGRGYQSIAAFPFASGTKDAGVITLYAPVTGFFDEEIVMLLEELARDITFALKTINDQQVQKASEELLRESGEKFRLIVENTQSIIYTFNAAGEVMYISPSVKEVLGYDQAYFTGHPFLSMVHPDDLPAAREAFRRSLRKDFKSTGIECRVSHVSGEWRWFITKGGIIQDEAGNVLYFTAVATDITERKRAEEVVRQANAKLNLLNSIIQHNEINTIAGLFGLIDMARDPSRHGDIESLLDDIKKLAEDFNQQIGFTHDYQAIGIKEPCWHSLEETVSRAMKPFAASGISVSRDIPGYEVYADPLLEKVFHNLIDDAVRRSHGLPVIRFTASLSEHGLSVICEDNGDGIRADMKEQIFRLGIGQHAGTGLFLAREILKITGITIWETGDPDSGARFEITVPKGMYRPADQKIT